MIAFKDLLSGSTRKLQPEGDDSSLEKAKLFGAPSTDAESKEASAFLDVICAVGGGQHQGSTSSDGSVGRSSSGSSSGGNNSDGSSDSGDDDDDDDDDDGAIVAAPGLVLEVPLPSEEDNVSKVFTAKVYSASPDDVSGDIGLDGSASSSPRLTIKQCRRRRSGSKGSAATVSSSLETNKEYEADLEELSKDYDEAEGEGDDLSRHVDGGDNPLFDPALSFRSGHSGSTNPADNRSESESATALDQRTIAKLLSNFIPDEEEEEDPSGSPRRYHNLASLKDNLKENLTETVGLLGSKLKNNPPPGDYSEVVKEDSPPGSSGQDLPIFQYPIREDEDRSTDFEGSKEDAYAIKDGPPIIKSLPSNLGGDRERPRNRRGTMESESMWTAVGSFTSALGLNRRGTQDSMPNSSFTSALGYNRRGTQDSTLSGSGEAVSSEGVEMYPLDGRGSDEGAVAAAQGGNGEGGSDGDGNDGGSGGDRFVNEGEAANLVNGEGRPSDPVDDEESQLTGIHKISGSVVSRRASSTPYVDDDGIDHHQYSPLDRDRANYRPGARTIRRCACVAVAIVLVILCSALIGNFVGTEHDLYTPLSHNEGTLKKEIEDIAACGHYTEAELFKMAESVDEYCHEGKLATAEGRWGCQQICHDHFCCFDLEQAGDGGGSSSYSCKDDRSKLCPVFAGCEILVLEDFDGPVTVFHNPDGSKQWQGGTTIMSGGHYSGKDADELAQQELTAEEDLGWQDVRRKYVDAYCVEWHVQSKQGRKQCQKVCEHHFCCFDTSKDGRNCRNDKSMTCDVYAGCQTLTSGLFDGPEGGGAAPELPKLPQFDGDDVFGDMMLPPPPGADDDDLAFGPIDPHEYTREELRAMATDVKERCRDYRSPNGRQQCEKICGYEFHCCFTDGKGSCRADAAELCDAYDPCKVLMVTSASSYRPLADKIKEEEEHPAKVAMMPPSEDEGEDVPYYWVDFDDDPVSGSRGDNVGEVGGPEEGDEVGDESYVRDNDDVEVPELAMIEIDETLRPTPEPVPEPATPKPTPNPTPRPTAANRPVQVSKATGKPPPPPPIRCIPQGDDEVHTEVYADDWNDDRYDRCKRWERKHGMTIGEYWEERGIDSALEKNMLENMLIMDKGKDSAAVAKEEEDVLDDEDLVLYEGEKDDEDGLDDLDDIVMLEDDDVEALDDMVFQVEEDFEEQDVDFFEEQDVDPWRF